MSQDAKVVQIRDGGGLAHLPAPLIRLRDLSANAVRQLLGEFFDSSDDALFNMADKAGSNREQVAYFDAMRELRLRRKHLTLAMQQWVARAFNEIGRFPRPQSDKNAAFDRDALTLVDDQTLEEQVALENMVTKARNRYNELLRLLEYRIAHLMKSSDLSASQMPLSPEVFCFGLGEACAELTIDIRAKLIVYKLFDKLMVARLEQFYREANDFLIRENVLPKMTRVPVAGHSRSSRTAAGHSGAVAYGGEDGGGPQSGAGDGYGFSELSALLHSGSAGAGNSFSGTPSGGGSLLGTSELVTLLSQAQPEFALSNDEAAGLPRLQHCVTHLVQHARKGNMGELGQVDADVINLVTMLFDFILEDRQLPPKMKALLARLQIPVLKVALLDRSFFNRGGHPARKLLNELAMAAIGWNQKSEGQRDPLLNKVETIVDRLLNEFIDNVELFDELLQDFQHFMNLEQRRRELVEQRLRDAEEGRARQEQARTQVENAIAASIGEHKLPDSTQKLLNEPWAKFLQWTFLRQGPESEAWKRALELTDQLVWTLDPQPVDVQTRPSMLKLIPTVVDGIRDGLRTISWDPFATDAIVRDLELAHVDTLQNLIVTREKPAPAPQDDLSLTEESPDLDLPVAPTPVVEPEREEHKESAVTPVEAQPVEETVVSASEQVTEPAVAEPDHTAAAAAIDPVMDESATVDEQWIQRAQALSVGSWLELVEDDNRLRCKLAAVIKATGKYIFVNRSGAKVAEYSLDTVATALEEGRLEVLDDGLIFDRALESIIDNLRHSRRD